MRQYYKILHEDLYHYGMQYHLGLNEDVKPFNPESECDSGLFFTDKEHVLDYLCYNHGTKLAVIEIPEGEQIVNIGDVYKAHRIVIKEIQNLWTAENYEWMQNNFNNNTYLFRCACRNGALDFAKWLYTNFKNIDIHAFNEYAFRSACMFGYLDIAKWLYGLGGIVINNDEISLFYPKSK